VQDTDRFIDPLPPIPVDEYEATTAARWDDSDLDLLAMIEAVRRGLCDLVGEEFYDQPLEGEYSGACEEDAVRAVQALIYAGFIPRIK
jgi:hypothetical protein